MQLKRTFTALTASALLCGTAGASTLGVQYLQYDEKDGRVSAKAPTLFANIDLSVDDVLRLEYGHDSVSGATPAWVDSRSGASAHVGIVSAHGAPIPIRPVYKNTTFRDNRDSASVLYTRRLENRDEVKVGFAYSKESDFKNRTVSLEFVKNFNQANTLLSIGANYGFNEINPTHGGTNQLGVPDILYADPTPPTSATSKNGSAMLNVTQLLSKSSYVTAGIFWQGEKGYLSNQYQTVVREYTIDKGKTVNEQYLFFENRPSLRRARGATMRYVTELWGESVLNTSYRYSIDDWKIASHTVEAKLYVQLGERFALIPGIRLYNQRSAFFYGDVFTQRAPTKYSGASQAYASSDFRLGSLSSATKQLGAEYKITKELKLNATASRYEQSSGLKADYFTGGFTLEF